MNRNMPCEKFLSRTWIGRHYVPIKDKNENETPTRSERCVCAGEIEERGKFCYLS